MSKDDTVTIKDAAFMLDTDMTQDMQDYRKEITSVVIKTINTSPELYKYMKESDSGYGMERLATKWAEAHGNEFGDVFQTELELVNWAEVARRV